MTKTKTNQTPKDETKPKVKDKEKKTNATKKVEEKKEVIKVDEKKKVTKEKKATSKLKEFFNKPTPIIVALVIICVVQLYFLITFKSMNGIYTGELNKEDVQIVNVHMFTNNDMNYFYASPAMYLGEDKQIYNFEMGYYVELSSGEMKSFATRSRSLNSASSLKEIVEEMSAWNFFETSLQDYFFSEEVLDNLDSMHFIIKASTKANSTDADVYIDYPIELNRITK